MEENHHIKDKLVTIAEFEQDYEAEMVRVALKEAGIESTVLGGDLLANMPALSPIRIQIQVFGRDVDRAQEILQAQPDQGEGDQGGDERSENEQGDDDQFGEGQ